MGFTVASFGSIPPEDTVRRNLVVLLVDASGSMGEPGSSPGRRKIDDLNDALEDFVTTHMHEEPKLQINGEIAIGAFSGDELRWLELGDPVVDGSPFHFARYVTNAPKLGANGATPMGKAIEAALQAIEQRKDDLSSGGLEHEYRPNVFLLTDGKPTDSVDKARRLLHEEESAKGVLFFALGTADADERQLLSIADKRNYYSLRSKPIAWYLKFVSKSLRRQAGRSSSDEAEAIYDDIADVVSKSDEVDRLLDGQ